MSMWCPIPKKGNAKEWSNYHTVALSLLASKVILKILQARLLIVREPRTSTCTSWFRKGRRTRDQIANISWIIEKAREFQKNIYFCFIDYAKAFDCVDDSKLWKILKEMDIPDHLICLLRNLYAGQEAQLESDMEQLTGSKLGKEYIRAVYCHPAYLTYMQSAAAAPAAKSLQSCPTLCDPIDGSPPGSPVPGIITWP